MSNFCLGVIVLCTFAGTAYAKEKISVIESDRVSSIDSDEYVKMLQASFISVYDSTVPALQQPPVADSKRMHLKSITVGIGATAAFSLGPVGSISITPKANLIFSNGPIGEDPNL